MKSHRLLAHLGALGFLSACASSDPASSASGGASSTAGGTASSGGANGSGAGGALATGGATGGAGAVTSGGAVATGGAIDTGGQAGSVGSSAGSAGGAGMPPAGGAGGMVGGSSAGCKDGIGLCDDFEAQAEGMPPSGRWTSPPVRNSAGSTMVVDSTKAFSGSKALHITGKFPSGGINSVVVSTKMDDPAFAGATTSGYVRFMMYLGTFTQSGATHGRIVRVGDKTIDSTTNPQGYAFDLHYAVPAQFQIEKFNDIYFGKVDPTPTLGKWVCWEIQIAPNMLNWWMDGTKVTSSTNFAQPLTLSKMTIGFETYTALPNIEFWLDDVAFDGKQRIGCPAAK